MGQPSKLNPERQKKIANAIVAGNYIEAACGFAGIDKQTHYNWFNRGKAEKERVEENSRANVKVSEKPYVDYFDAIKEALEIAEIRAVSVITKAAMGDAEVRRVKTMKTTTKANGDVVEETHEEVQKLPPVWQASAWWLERKFPERWGRKPSIGVGVQVGKPAPDQNAPEQKQTGDVTVKIIAGVSMDDL